MHVHVRTRGENDLESSTAVLWANTVLCADFVPNIQQLPDCTCTCIACNMYIKLTQWAASLMKQHRSRGTQTLHCSCQKSLHCFDRKFNKPTPCCLANPKNSSNLRYEQEGRKGGLMSNHSGPRQTASNSPSHHNYNFKLPQVFISFIQ